MAQFNISQIVDATKGELRTGSMRTRIHRVTTNSRDVKKGDLFIALVGKKHDGHDFIQEVIEKGAVGIVISREVQAIPMSSTAVIRVVDTTKALGDIARFHRQRFNIPVIAITGSAGKTTTKEMVAAVLKTKYKVLKNIGTENNQFGVPLTILRMKLSDEIAVLEVGTNTPGDIPWLASIVCPTVSMITNIGESHLERLKTPSDVFKEKFALVKALGRKGIAVINNDDPFLRKVPRLIKQKTYTFGIKNRSMVNAARIEISGNWTRFSVHGSGDLMISGTSKACIYNGLAALCCGRLFKIPDPIIKKVLRKFSLKSGRQEQVKVGGILVIDDSYNANPVSFRNALDGMKKFNPRGRRILICADMLELGAHSERLHREIGEYAAASGVEVILSFGKLAKLINISAKSCNPGVSAFHYVVPEKLEDKIRGYLRPGDVVLVKGSRGMNTERYVEFIKKSYKGR